jgi:hypothetical protein
MEKDRFTNALLFPLLSMLVIIGYAGGLGVTFMLVDHYVLEEWGVVIIGMSLVVGVPVAAALLQRALERRE